MKKINNKLSMLVKSSSLPSAILLLSAGQLVGQDAATNSSNIAVNATAIGANAISTNNNNSSIIVNSSNIATNSSDIAALSISSSDIATNAAAIAQEVTDRDALIRRDADNNIRIGANTLIFNDTTDTISTTSGDLTLGANVEITGDLNIAGLTGDVASRINDNSNHIASNSNRIASNKEGIEQNARGIAMVAALQHTTVLPGMTNALDVSAAHFEG